jgi:ABC-type sugar transport system ATPase subunit
VTALDAAERNVAMVFEDYALYPHLTAAQNIAFPLEVRGRPRDEIRRATDGAIALLGLEAVRDTRVRLLSGGAQQRVGIGRALVREPAVILFDEPLSHLDGAQKSQLRAEIKRLQHETGVTGVLVTHDQTEAMAMADRVAVMDHGALQQVGTADDLYERPANLFVAQFIGEPPMNLFTGELGRRGDRVVLESEAGDLPLPCLPAGDPRRVVVGVRPEHLRLVTSDSDGLSGSVFFREHRGDSDIVLVALSLGGHDGVAVEVESGAPWRPGDAVRVCLARSMPHFFDTDSGVRLGDEPAANVADYRSSMALSRRHPSEAP